MRRFTSADADLVFELDSDPAVMRYISGGIATTVEGDEHGETDYALTREGWWLANR